MASPTALEGSLASTAAARKAKAKSGAENKISVEIKAGAEKKSDLTRQRILDSAAKILAQRGYAHTRLSDIAADANAHTGGIYYYFSSREQLVEEVLQTATRQTIDAITGAISRLPAESSTAEVLACAIAAQITAILAKDSYSVAFLKIYSQVPDELKEQHRPVLREFFSLWRGIIRDGQARGEIRVDLDPAVIRLVIVGAVQWSVEWANSSLSSAEELGEEIASIFFEGIRTSGTPALKRAARKRARPRDEAAE
jgi:AcrR family transcriptional regulator